MIRSNVSSLSPKLEKNIQHVKEVFSDSTDLIVRRFQFRDGTKAALVYFVNLVDKVSMNEQVLHTLMFKLDTVTDLWETEISVPVGNAQILKSWQEIEQTLMEGYSLLFCQGRKEAILFETKGWPKRAIQEPHTESALFGSHQGFTETAEVNISLLRRYIPNQELRMDLCEVGDRAKTKIYLSYLADVVNPSIVKNIKKKIQTIQIDAILNTGELAELLEEHPYSLLPQSLLTERPDTAASHIYQGRLAIIVDHSPGVLIVPITFFSFFQHVDDYGSRWTSGTLIRLLRFLALLIASMLPALYIAMISFHFEVIPLDLMISVAMSREKIPFPPVFEALLMEISIEMIREAGIRLPSPVGQTVGVVGGIVIGEAAVQANIVSNVMVIIVAITAISSYIIPNYELANAVRIIRFPLMLLASIFGMVGIAIGILVVLVHLISLRSVGIDYGAPLIPIHFQDWKDTLIRAPIQWMKKRPSVNRPLQRRRQESGRTRRGS